MESGDQRTARGRPESEPLAGREPWTHGWSQLSSVKLHNVHAGPVDDPDAPLVVLLHGFPEFWYSWRHQIPALANAGFAVVAPDMRGYNLSDKPKAVRDYRLEALAADVEELIRSYGRTRAHVVGHDWGGMVAWWFAMHHQAHLDRLCVMNCPHPGYQLAMMSDFAQLRRSHYMLMFQVPFGIPERTLCRNDYAPLRKLLRHDPARRDAFTDQDIERYVDAFSGDTPRAAMNYYRALLRRSPWGLQRKLKPITRPVQVIWGTLDRHLGIEYGRPKDDWVHDITFESVDDASHWVQVDRPQRVNPLLREFLQAGSP